MKTCDDYQLELVTADGPLAADVEAHLATCAACQRARDEATEVLAAAAPAPVTPAEQVMLGAMPVTALQAWRAQSARRSAARRALGLALAAGLGAVLASGVLLWRQPVKTKVVEKVVVKEVPAEESVALADLALGFGFDGLDETVPDDDSVDVSWPQLIEGEEL